MKGRQNGHVARRLRVHLGERGYAIQLGVDTLADAGAAIAKVAPSERAFVITVPSVSRRYAPTLTRSLRDAGYRVKRVVVPDGDASKSPRQLMAMWDELIAFGADRTTPVIALGGGVVGDLAGFAAASFLRGVPFIQIPTTVLSMVDASIGGKVAVNLKQGKNLVGAFYQPRLVWIDTATLESLPARDRAAGFAEVIKAGAIRDRRYFARLERQAASLMELEPETLIPALARACEIKADVVATDEREEGLRRILNFGHSLAHAVEQLSRYRGPLHGEAVAMGMVAAARISEALECSPPGTADRVRALVEAFGLPTELPQHSRSAYLRALRVDKKMANSKLHFVVLRGIGAADSVALTPRQVLSAGWPRGAKIGGNGRESRARADGRAGVEPDG